MPFELVIEGLPKRGCLRISATLVGSDFVRPGLTLIHAPRKFFQMEHGSLLSLGAAKIQLIFGVFGPLPCTGSLVSLALCLTNSFHDSPLGARPLTNSFVNRASGYVLGSMLPRPPLEIGRESMSHFTLALTDVALPPQMKFRTTPHTWLHILGLGF